MAPTMATWASIHSHILQKVRENINWDLPVQQWQVLCEVAANPGINSSELKNRLNMTGGSLSRNIKMLSRFYDQKTAKQKGYDLIEAQIDPYERRSRIYFLTTKGQKAMMDIFKAAKAFNLDIISK